MSCPLKMNRNDETGCCCWGVFEDDFPVYWGRWFDCPPSLKDWQKARTDWRAGNTPYEAAHNAQRRAKDLAAKVGQPHLVHLGGRNYAPAGSSIALRYGKKGAS